MGEIPRNDQREGNDGPLLTLKEAASRLKVSIMTVRRLIDSEDLPVVRVTPSAPRIDAADLERFIEDRRSGMGAREAIRI